MFLKTLMGMTMTFTEFVDREFHGSLLDDLMIWAEDSSVMYRREVTVATFGGSERLLLFLLLRLVLALCNLGPKRTPAVYCLIFEGVDQRVGSLRGH